MLLCVTVLTALAVESATYGVESVWDDAAIDDADEFVNMDVSGTRSRTLLGGGSGGSGAAPSPTVHAQIMFNGTCDGGANALTLDECRVYAVESNLALNTGLRTAQNRRAYPAGPFGQCIILNRWNGPAPGTIAYNLVQNNPLTKVFPPPKWLKSDYNWRVFYNDVINAGTGTNMTNDAVRSCSEQYPCVCKTPAGAAPTPAPTPVACPVRLPQFNGIIGRAVCDCPDPLYQKTAFSDSRRRRRADSRRRRRGVPSSMEDPVSNDIPVRYICNYTGPPTQAPTPAPTPLPNCPTLATKYGIRNCWPNGMDRPECSFSKACGCATTAYPQRVIFSDSRRRAPANTGGGLAVPDDPPRYHCAGGDGTTAAPTSQRRRAPASRRRAPGKPTTTRAPRRPTRAPTPTQKFQLRRPKLVLATKLAGFTVASFNRGVRWAYRRAFARRYKITDVLRVIITDIRAADGRHLGSRALTAVEAIQFNVQVETNTTAAATTLKAEVTGGDAAEEVAFVAEFKTEIANVAASGEYPQDVPADYSAPAATTVVTQAGYVTLETGAPTPAPTSAGGSAALPVPAIVGAVTAAAVIAAVAMRRSKLRTAAAGNNVPTGGGGDVQMASIAPGGSSDMASNNKGDGTNSVL